MNATMLLDIVVAASLGLTGGAFIVAWRAGVHAREARLALQIARAREAAFVAAARRLSDAARESIAAVRAEIDRAVRVVAPHVDIVLIFEEHEAQLVCVAAFGPRVAFFDGARVALDDADSLLVAALTSGYRVTSSDRPDLRRMHPADAFAVAIPLVLDAGRRCVLYVGSDRAQQQTIADRIVQLVDGATPAYRIALERADDRARAEYDGLTGLLTPRAFRARLAELIERVRFAPLGRVGVLFIDTDRFKAWNDTYGHASGDALLRELARLLNAAAHDRADIVGRNGGDEFCIVFADAEKSQAVERAALLRDAIAGADFGSLIPAGTNPDAVRISASIGIACFPADADSPEVLLEKADAAMYHTKRTGRNGVTYLAADGQAVRAESDAPAPDPLERRLQ